MLNPPPLLSVITINKDNDHGLLRTQLSISQQNNQQFEWIVIDGMSKSSCRFLHKLDRKPDFFVSETDSGISHAFNKGILNSSGEFLLFLNSGDVFSSHDSVSIIHKVLSSAKPHTNAFIFPGLIHDRGSTTYRLAFSCISWYFRIFLANVFGLRLFMFFRHQSTIYARQLHELYGVYDLNYLYAMDYEFFLRSWPSIRFIFADYPITSQELGGISSDYKRRLAEQKKARIVNSHNSITRFISIIINYIYKFRP